MTAIYNHILKAKAANQKLLAILIDPDKIDLKNISLLTKKINQSPATHVFVGGSHVESQHTDQLLEDLKKNLSLPFVLFPGNPSQISNKADGILFLHLISGRNPDYLIEHHVNAVPILKKTQLEIIPTGYILIESGKQTAVQRISKTKPLDREDYSYVLQTAQAGEMLGHKLIYLEAGSGASLAVPLKMITLVSQNIGIPLIVGGGIVSRNGIDLAHEAGADLVVIGTAFENDNDFFVKNKT
jgi:phosphoglycerol geranylgeranyltransferase